MKQFCYHCINEISPEGLSDFGEEYLPSDISHADGILIRSSLLDKEIMPSCLKVIGKAGVGVNNIPVEECTKRGIVVLHVPGSNANAVKEMVLLAMLLTSRNILPALEWMAKERSQSSLFSTMEKKKNHFLGREILGKRLAIIGLGAVGSQVARAATRMGMEVVGYDPYVKQPPNSCVHLEDNLEKAVAQADYISLHLPENNSTKNIVDRHFLSHVSSKCILLNFSTAGVVDHRAVLQALNEGQLRQYVTDFPTKECLKNPHVVAFPHLGAATVEAQKTCATGIVMQMKDFLENGNICDAVNYPSVSLGQKQKEPRLGIFHQNIPSMLQNITSILSNYKVNILNLDNKSKKEVAYTLVEINEQPLEILRKIEEDINRLGGVLRIRLIE